METKKIQFCNNKTADKKNLHNFTRTEIISLHYLNCFEVKTEQVIC